jgi:hypothetical protein
MNLNVVERKLQIKDFRPERTHVACATSKPLQSMPSRTFLFRTSIDIAKRHIFIAVDDNDAIRNVWLPSFDIIAKRHVFSSIVLVTFEFV